MREGLYDQRWKRSGISVIWDINAIESNFSVLDVISIDQLFSYSRGGWIDELPSFNGDALIVAGLDNIMEVIPPNEMMQWMESSLYKVLLDFQKEYQGQAALIFLLPSAKGRLKYLSSEDTFVWQCSGPNKDKTIPLTKCLWNGAEKDARYIIEDEKEQKGNDLIGIGLYHPRIS